MYMNVERGLPESIIISYQEIEYIHTIDYEDIPFRYRKFHEHGHLFIDCPRAKECSSGNKKG
jgi:hypothetical protein